MAVIPHRQGDRGSSILALVVTAVGMAFLSFAFTTLIDEPASVAMLLAILLLSVVLDFVLAVLVTQMDVFNRLLGTTQINLREFAWALLPPIALLVLRELGKLAARRSTSATVVPAQGEP